MSEPSGNKHDNDGSHDENQSHGRRIGNIVDSAFHSGDLSRLKDLGPAVKDAVQDAVKDIPGVRFDSRQQGGTPAPRRQQGSHPYVQNTQNYTQPGAPGYTKMTYPYDTRAYRQPKAPMQNYKNNVPKGIFSIVFGILGMVAFGLCTLTFSVLAAVSGGTFLTPLAGGCAMAFAGCTALTSAGFGKNKLAKRAQQYYALFDKKPVLTYEQIAAEVGRTPKQIRKDLRKMKAKGWMLDIKNDEGDTCLMRGEDTYKQYLESKKTQQERQEEEALRQERMKDPEVASLEHFRSQGVETIRKIRNANEAIPGEEISEKLSRLEATCARIFSYVEAHPEKLPDTSKFMDYYLPTTLKLVEKYRQYEEMDFQPDNVKEAKQQIENTLDTIDDAFKNLLESLFQEDTLDVSTDIVVLQRMLEQEGLSGKKFDIDDTDASKIRLTTGE